MFVFSTDLCFRALYFISNNECLHLVFVYNISHVEKEIGEKWEFKSKCSSCETCTQHKLITANYSLDTGVIDRFKEVDIVSGSQKLMCKCLKQNSFSFPVGDNFTDCKKEHNCFEACEKMTQFSTWFITSVNEFIVSIISFRSSSRQHDVHFVNYGQI